MNVIAPGKLLLSGAYAVLEGAPALVVAVDRHAVADGARRAANATPEVLSAMSAEDAPEVGASALREGGFKLGLGSSAAILVASLGVAYARAGKDLRAPDVRRALFLEARRAHAKVQDGGSGVDVAASVHGGALAYTLAPDGSATVAATTLPRRVVIDVFWCGVPAVTTAMRTRVAGLRDRDAAAYRTRIDEIASASRAAIAACHQDDASAYLSASRAGALALTRLGDDADAPIVPPATRPLVALAETDGNAFFPSGAGGGDVFVHLGTGPLSSTFRTTAAAAGMRLIAMHPDLEGVRVSSRLA